MFNLINPLDRVLFSVAKEKIGMYIQRSEGAAVRSIVEQVPKNSLNF